MDRAVSLTWRDADVLKDLETNGSVPMADLFWKHFATADETARRSTQDTNTVSYSRCKRRIDELVEYGFVGTERREAQSAVGVENQCERPGCAYQKKALGLCSTHYRRFQAGQSLDEPIEDHRRKVCSLTDLGRVQLYVLEHLGIPHHRVEPGNERQAV